MRDLKDRAAIFLEEMNISGDTMVQMNHRLDDIPEDKIGAYYLDDLMAGFVQEQLNLYGLKNLVCDHDWVHNYHDETKEICRECYAVRDKQTCS